MAGSIVTDDITMALRLIAALSNTESTGVATLLNVHGVSRRKELTSKEHALIGLRVRPISTALRAVADAPDAVTSAINAELERLRIEPRLVDHDGVGTHLHWTRGDIDAVGSVIADLVLALAGAVTTGQVERLRVCAAPRCDRLLFDETKNRSARHCPDSTCANRARQQRHRDRRADR